MRVRIHRGTKEIGGSCTELEAGGERLLLDLGLPLDGDPGDVSVHPAIDGLDGQVSLRALILSHGHLDHWGLAYLAGKELPIALGAATHRIFHAAAPFLPRSHVPENTLELRDRTPMPFGPFKATPYLVDHSAYDAYALEVEAGGCLDGAVAVWSQRGGYLKQENGMQVSEALRVRDIRLEHAHTSGHASIADLKRLVAALEPRMLVPIHTFEPHRFPDHFGAIAEQKNDGERWEIAA